MPLEVVRNDITKMQVDAIVNPTQRNLFGRGGTDGRIHRVAGPELRLECLKLGVCKVGHAKITGGYNLPCKYVIHTVGPRWHGGDLGEKDALIACYKNSLDLAKQHNCQTIAFPLISAGRYQFPKAQALQIAISTINDFLMENDMTVYLLAYDSEVFSISKKLFSSINDYIENHYTEPRDALAGYAKECCATCAPEAEAVFVGASEETLSHLLQNLDAGFTETLLALIDRSGEKDSAVYKRAFVSRKHFSKIRSNVDYKPSKPTAIAFAFALRLTWEEAKDLLSRAGYALTHSSKFDLIVEYCLKNKIYDLYQVNELLLVFDQSLLGV